MRKRLAPLLVVAVAIAAPRAQHPAAVVDVWIDAAMAHRPGALDPPLVAMATARPEGFRAVAGQLRVALERRCAKPEARNDVRRRGALLHTDIALLLPVLAGNFTDGSAELATSHDGEYVASNLESGHWSFASALLAGVTPDPAADEFVKQWYRAVAAMFQGQFLLGNGTSHMKRALRALPRDPILLFYAGAMSEALSSPRFQNVPSTAPNIARHIALPSQDDQLREAERRLREAVRYGAPPEARVRLAHVLAGRGRHVEAATLLQETAPPAGDPRVAYLRELFLGTEQGALGHVDAARASLERAANLFPAAQAPLVAMSDVFRRTGDRAAALDALRRLQALPADTSARMDPWWDYHRSYAADADAQLAALRASVEREATR